MAIDVQIQERLEGLARRRRRIGLWRSLALAWAGAVLLGLAVLLLEKQSGWASSLALPIIGLIGIISAIVGAVRNHKRRDDPRALAYRVETLHPELNGRLVTALQQRPPSGGQLNYLQQRLMEETIEWARGRDWAEVVPSSKLIWAQVAHWCCLVFFVVALCSLKGTGGTKLLSRSFSQGIAVTPGDISLERGSSLVVLARFKGTLPASVNLAYGQGASLKRVALFKTLGDPMFGGSVPEVSSNFVYHIEYGKERTRDFNVNVYEHPRLERADVELSFPAYTGLARKRIENTRRLSAVEGSQVDLELRFNKPVASARLLARDKSRTSVPLALDPEHPAAKLKQFALAASGTYDLQLVDAEGRTNKVPAEFVFEALKNRTPELRLTAPRGDLRPSPIEEIPFEGTVWDDFGVQAFGIAYAVNGQNPKFLEIGGKVPGNEKKSFKHRLRLEDVGVKPDELVSWFVWADDLGPDGQVRRTMGDLYFGEVRPFDEVFREGQGMDGAAGAEGQGGEDRTGKLADLEKQIVNATWKLQRDHATGGRESKEPADSMTPRRQPERPPDQSWNPAGQDTELVRKLLLSDGRYRVAGQVTRGDSADSLEPQARPIAPVRSQVQPPKYEDDATVVLQSQAQALEQARQALQNQRDPRTAGLWQKAVSDMEAALARLQKATNSPAALRDALASEEDAYQALIRLQAHEYQVMRSRNRNQSGSGRNQQMQRQLEELDLKNSENRYENQREAQRAQNPQQREQLQMMSRLQELARRQQDLNDRLKELQSALQEASTEEQRAEIRRQLKRLQEEEQQMLADVDELRQRMDQPENQSQMGQERRQLDQTRQEVQRAADSAAQGAASQALAAGTRAQNQLQQLRDEMRKKNSSQFAEDMRQMRSQARELSRQQEDILKKIQEGNQTEQKSLSGGVDQEQTRTELARQKQLMTNLLDRATQISQQAEQAEPLLSKQLEDSVRKFTQDTAKDLKEAQNELLKKGPMTRSLLDLLRDDSEQNGPKLEELTSELLRQGFLPQAGSVGERARSGLDNLKKGVERAAESVLGDDTESLRLANRELDDLSNQLAREIAEGQGRPLDTNRSGSGPRSGSDNLAAAESSTNVATQAGSGKQQQSQPGQAAGQQSGQQGQTAGQQQPGSKPGDTSQQASSSQPGQSQSSDGQSPGNQPGSPANAQAAQSEASGNSNQPGQRGNGLQTGMRNGARRQAGAAGGGGGDPQEANLAPGAGGGARDWNQLLTESARRQAAPITGEDFTTWSDRLREVEQLIDDPAMRDDVAKARERARLMRQEFKQERKKPDWAVVQLQVMKPLTEVRQQIAEELARRESREALVPLDRDPVPNRYSELVRRYYQELGKDK